MRVTYSRERYVRKVPDLVTVERLPPPYLGEGGGVVEVDDVAEVVDVLEECVAPGEKQSKQLFQ